MNVNPHRRALLGATAVSAMISIVPRAWGAQLGYPRLMEGPMAGPPGPSHLTLWGRTSGAFDAVVEVSKTRDFKEKVVSAPVRAGEEKDYCVTVRVDGLEPNTEYFYRFLLAGKPDRYQPVPYRTRTAPAGVADFRVGFGSCCRISTDPEQRIFTAAALVDPDLFFWLGDNIYADTDSPNAMADHYRRQRAVDRLQTLIRKTPQLAIWDDHDFGFNDSDGANPIKEDSLRLFSSYWANPSYGLPGTPGVFFKYSYGGVDFFFLDGRYNRDKADTPDKPGKTMLGATQKAWLKQELKASTAPFKILVSGTGFSLAESGGDSWAMYVHERNEIFEYIRTQKIEGVVCISGDSHMGELNCVPWSEKGGYDIYDLVSSPLAQLPDSDFVDQAPEVRIRNTWTRSCNFGLLSFSMGETPTLTFTLHNTLGDAVWAPLVLTPDDLKNGASTWKQKIDPKELRRLERYKKGKGYYGAFPEEKPPR